MTNAWGSQASLSFLPVAFSIGEPHRRSISPFVRLFFCVWEEKNVTSLTGGRKHFFSQTLAHTHTQTPHKTETKRSICCDKLRRRHPTVGLLEAQRVFEDARLRSHIQPCWGTSSEAAEIPSPSADSSVGTQKHSRALNADKPLFIFISDFSHRKKKGWGHSEKKKVSAVFAYCLIF